MSLKVKLFEDMKTAMKSGEKIRLDTIRLLRSKIGEAEIAKIRDLTEDEIIGVFLTAVKQRNDAIAMYQQGGRQDLAEKETAEKAVIESYLPKPLSPDELRDIVRTAIAETGAQSIKQMGAVMNAVMAQAKGRADGKVVNQLVRELLPG